MRRLPPSLAAALLLSAAALPLGAQQGRPLAPVPSPDGALPPLVLPPEPVLRETLERDGKTLDWFRGLAEPRQREEFARLFPTGWPPRLSLRMRDLRPPLTYAPPANLSEAGVDLRSPEAARLRLDSTFDGAVPEPGPLIPAWEGLGHELAIQNMQLKRFALFDERLRLRLEFGQLGIVPVNPLIRPSYYANFRHDRDFTGPWGLEHGLRLQAGVVNLGARLFYDDAPQLDERIDLTLGAAETIGAGLGLRRSWFETARDRLSVDTSFETQPIFVGSALHQVGRTFRLAGPFDIGFVAGTLARVTHRFPNAALDQTVALRYRAAPGLSLGVFAGVSEALGILGPTAWADSAREKKVETDIRLQAAPHVGAEAWGALPGLPQSRFNAGLIHQFNPMTQATDVHAGVFFPTGRDGAGVSVRGRYDRERGQAIEFDRNRGGAQLGLRTGAGIELFAGYDHERWAFGNAEIQNHTGMIGLRGEDLGQRPHPVRVSIEQVYGGQDRLLLPPSKAFTVIDEAKRLAEFWDRMWALHADDVGRAWADLARQYASLPAAARDEIERRWRERFPNLPPLGTIMSGNPSSLPVGTALNALTTFFDPEVYERVVVRYIRHMVLEELKNEPLDLWFQEIQLNAPTVLALAHAYSVGLQPIPPLTQADARNALDPLLFNELKDLVGACGDTADTTRDERQWVDCLLGRLPAPVAGQLQRRYGAALTGLLKEAIQWHSDVIRREVNRTILEVLRAAETLNELTVDQGVRLSGLQQQWLIGAFERQSARERRSFDRYLRGARESVQQDLEEQDRVLRAKLTSYGASRLERLRREGLPVEVPEEQLPALLAFYGDELFTFLEQAKRRLGFMRELRVEFDSVSRLGGTTTVVEPGRVTVKLSPVEDEQRARSRLRSALENLGGDARPERPALSPLAPGPF